MANKTRVYNKEAIQEIISLYLHQNKIDGEIQYSSIRDFAFELYKNKHYIFTDKMYFQLLDSSTGNLSEKIYKYIKLSDDFWRKPQYQGRQIIDETNDLLSKTASKPRNRQTVIPNTDFLVDDNISNLPQLKLQLKPLEQQLKSNLDLIDKLEGKISELETVIASLKEDKRNLKVQNKALQDSLYIFFELSALSDIPLKNQMNTGIGKMKLVDETLKKAFSGNPNIFYQKYENNRNTIDQDITNTSSLKEFLEKREAKVVKYHDVYNFESD
ncbi:cell division protein ZapB [Paenibacillus sp. LS1]|uniref:cell division protein ZapB n=1 Tax=Paenibacillus sp. LS1 TaxID=2992120 RepID=UPI002231FF44|nr:cell division protein ZapB [Paenibacillus sp. LS1]MCW3792639.1 cell division protein ZapB [Paenibacillus sp. LS1]